jgi:hypothetical protein
VLVASVSARRVPFNQLCWLLWAGLCTCRTLTAGSHTPQQPLHVDCANGVGALKLQQLVPQLQKLGLQLQLYNAGRGRLNHGCGADYVQKEQSFPAGEAASRVCMFLRFVKCASCLHAVC